MFQDLFAGNIEKLKALWDEEINAAVSRKIDAV
jgi:hypothetical protein